MRIAFLVDSSPSDSSEACGIGDYTVQVSGQIHAPSFETRVFDRRSWNKAGTIRLLRKIRAFRPDVLHIQYPTIGYLRAFTAPLFAAFSPAPHVVLTAHEFIQAHPLRKICIGFMARYSSRIIFPSEFERQAFLSRYPDYSDVTSVIPIGSNIDSSGRSPFEERDPDTVAYFGQLRPEKGIEDFIDLVKIASAEARRFKFRIIGTPHPNHIGYYKSLREKTSTLPVEWDVGFSAEQVTEALGNCTFAYLPFPDGASERRGSLLAVLGNGLVTITTRGAQTPASLNGAVIFVREPADALAELEALADDQTRRDQHTKAGTEFAGAFSWDRIAEEHRNIYEDAHLLKPPRRYSSPKCAQFRRTGPSRRKSLATTFHPERGKRSLRFLDRYMGIPIVFVLGLFKRKRKVPDQISRIGLLKTAAIGDTVLISAAIEDLAQKYPKAEIVILTGDDNFETAQLLPAVNSVVRLPIRRPLKAIRMIRNAGSFDAWIDFGPWPRLDALFSFFARARFKLGFKTQGQYRHFGYDGTVMHSSLIHEVSNFKNLLKPLGVRGSHLPFVSVKGTYPDSGYMVVHIFPGGTRSYLREWDEDNWVQLIASIIDGGFNVYLTGAGFDRDRAVELKRKVGSDHVKVVAGEISIEETARLLRSSTALITVNTGIMHLGAALGCKVISLNGPTSPVRWGPLGTNSAVLFRNPSGPCMDLGFESKCKVNSCMKNISLEDVLQHLRPFFGQRMAKGTSDDRPADRTE